MTQASIFDVNEDYDVNDKWNIIASIVGDSNI